MKIRHCSILLILAFINCDNNIQNKTGNDRTIKPIRNVQDNLISSQGTPLIDIKVSNEFSYIGKFDFEIIANSEEYPDDIQGKPVASGERLVFVVADNVKRIEKLFVVQFEGFLASNDFIYNYNFSQAEYIGKNKYRKNTWIYNARENARENPLGEGAKTIKFLEDRGYQLEDSFMMSRYLGLASDDRKNEIIIYYQEMLKKTTGYTLDQFENSLAEDKKKDIIHGLIERSKESFVIVKG